MKTLLGVTRKVWAVGGWAPLAVFVTHVFLSRVLNAYVVWPATDIPLHFAGGLAMAFFLSRCFQTLPREVLRSSRVVVLELILVGSLTATAAVFWEFAEFSVDRVFGTNVQVGLANTMKDLALGVAGAGAFMVWRGRELRAGRRELQEVVDEWVTGAVPC
jgi:hypothetical protein